MSYHVVSLSNGRCDINDQEEDDDDKPQEPHRRVVQELGSDQHGEPRGPPDDARAVFNVQVFCVETPSQKEIMVELKHPRSAWGLPNKSITKMYVRIPITGLNERLLMQQKQK
jgi:hypothetical protein